MSIMYEAIQNTQSEDDMQSCLTTDENMTLDDWIDVGISLTIAVLLAAIIVAHYPQLYAPAPAVQQVSKTVLPPIPDETLLPMQESAPSPVKPIAKVKPVLSPAEEDDYKLKHILNGVFVSDEEKVAMINNRFFNIGDSIDGMKIVSIEPDKIKLENEHGMLELKIVV